MHSDNNNEKKKTWRNWLIKKLLTNEASKKDVLQILGETVEDDTEIKNHNFEDIEEKITPKTKAIMIVHIFGLSADIDPILKIAKKYKLQ